VACVRAGKERGGSNGKSANIREGSGHFGSMREPNIHEITLTLFDVGGFPARRRDGRQGVIPESFT